LTENESIEDISLFDNDDTMVVDLYNGLNILSVGVTEIEFVLVWYDFYLLSDSFCWIRLSLLLE